MCCHCCSVNCVHVCVCVCVSMRECVHSRICVYFIALKFHRSEFLRILHNMRHMRICFNEHMCAYMDGIHKSISNQIHKERSHKGYCIVWDGISAAATLL